MSADTNPEAVRQKVREGYGKIAAQGGLCCGPSSTCCGSSPAASDDLAKHIGYSPEELAAKLNINYTSFRKKFRDITGFSPAHYYKTLKIKKAKQLLVETSDPVKEISYLLNYRTVENFVTLFKNKTGYTPSEYRKFSR